IAKVTSSGGEMHRYLGYKKVAYTASRLAWAFTHGKWPSNRMTFLDGDSLNTQIENLGISRGVHEGKHDHTTPEGRSAYLKAHRAQNKDHYRDKDLRKNFGITIDQYNEMLANQGGVCAICSQPERSMRGENVKLLAVDHCHSTGEIRQLLCSRCNPMLGYAGDSSDMLRKGADYIDKHQHQRLAEAPLPNNVVKLKEAR
ncbi:MAG TPA: endonuclease domain-containing protein, partial [Phycisphaerae bacterium]|nr:endonuclease domain-containing protein [Phycisphaerae bacterium]